MLISWIFITNIKEEKLNEMKSLLIDNWNKIKNHMKKYYYSVKIMIKKNSINKHFYVEKFCN